MTSTDDDGNHHRFENVALGVLALIVVLTIIYAIATRPAQGPVVAAEFAAVMPDNYEPVLAALIRAGGQECDSVCTASLAEPALGPRRVRASCAVAARHITCAQATDFEITIAPAPRPSR